MDVCLPIIKKKFSDEVYCLVELFVKERMDGIREKSRRTWKGIKEAK